MSDKPTAKEQPEEAEAGAGPAPGEQVASEAAGSATRPPRSGPGTAGESATDGADTVAEAAENAAESAADTGTRAWARGSAGEGAPRPEATASEAATEEAGTAADGETLTVSGPAVDAQTPTAALSEAEADSLLPEVRKVTNVLQDHSGEYDPLFEQKISLLAAISSHEAAITRAKAMLKIVDEAIEKRMREKSKRERDEEERRLREEMDKFSDIDDRIAELTRELEERTRRWKWLKDLFRFGRKQD